jgi:DNA-binding SARP family transcriptional activator
MRSVVFVRVMASSLLVVSFTRRKVGGRAQRRLNGRSAPGRGVGYGPATHVLEFRILGPFEARQDGEVVRIGGPKQRALLAILVLNANQPVSVDRLIEELWGGAPPGTAAHSIEVYVSQLRKALGDAGAIVTQRPGYRLQVEPEHIDLHRFESLVTEGLDAVAAGDPAAGAARLREALRLWRGAPLGDFAFETFAQGAIARLEELRLAALEDRIDADLALGRHTQVIGELEGLVSEHTLRERPRAQLMLALYRAGRQAEALEAYAATRAVLVEELGIEPSPALQRLERAILNQDASLELDAPSSPRGTRVEPTTRSILLAGSGAGQLEALLALAAPLARSASPHELIVVSLLAGADAARLAEETGRLEARRTALLEQGLAVRAAAFTTDDPGADVVRLASQQDVDLLLLDARGAPTGPFDADLTAQLDGAPCDVALLVAGAPDDAPPAGAVVVPFGGSDDDWSALELGAWLATGSGAPLALCGAAAHVAVDRRDASRLLATASLVVQQLAGVAAQPVLTAPTVEGVVEAAAGAWAVVVGVSPRWRSEGLGPARSAIAAAVDAPYLVVRRGLRPGGLSPPEGMTRFTWSLAATPAD